VRVIAKNGFHLVNGFTTSQGETAKQATVETVLERHGDEIGRAGTGVLHARTQLPVPNANAVRFLFAFLTAETL
jgi:hypothetical protein